jgi:hypothetical protein
MGDENKDDVRAALDASLGTIDEVLNKSAAPSDEDLEALMADPKTAERVVALAKAYEGEDEGEGEDEAKKEEKAEKKKKKGAVPPQFKSEEDAATEGEDLLSKGEDMEEFVDAVPVMKSIHDRLEALAEVIGNVAETQEAHSTVLKSLVEAASETFDMSKSISDSVSIFGSKPKPRKGATTGGAVLTKNFGDEAAEDAPEVSPKLVKSTMMKAFKDEEVSMTDVTKAEIAGFTLDSVPADIRERIVGGE